jgi:AcrR family transcriptional regulator
MANRNITERAIHEAFVELLSKKALDRITVRDITEQAGISRNTFYYHYQDVPALLEDILEKDADRVIAEYPRLNSIEECLEAAMQFARANRRIIMHIFNSGSSTNIASLWRVCEHVITTYADTVLPDVPISEGDRMLFIRYHKCACFGLVTDWINSGMKEDYVEGMRRICELKKGSAELIIKNASAERGLH